jgi:hypothetical protein
VKEWRNVNCKILTESLDKLFNWKGLYPITTSHKVVGFENFTAVVMNTAIFRLPHSVMKLCSYSEVYVKISNPINYHMTIALRYILLYRICHILTDAEINSDYIISNDILVNTLESILKDVVCNLKKSPRFTCRDWDKLQNSPCITATARSNPRIKVGIVTVETICKVRGNKK